jgi:lipid-binding SYLF domain-containing protein
MATERVTEHADGTRERVIERDGGGPTYVERGGSGVGGVIIGVAVLALVAIIAFFLLSQNRNDTLRTSAVTGAAHSVSNAAGSVGDAAQRAADSTTSK